MVHWWVAEWYDYVCTMNVIAMKVEIKRQLYWSGPINQLFFSQFLRMYIPVRSFCDYCTIYKLSTLSSLARKIKDVHRVLLCRWDRWMCVFTSLHYCCQQATAKFGDHLSVLEEIKSLVCSHLHQMFIFDPNLTKLVHYQVPLYQPYKRLTTQVSLYRAIPVSCYQLWYRVYPRCIYVATSYQNC